MDKNNQVKYQQLGTYIAMDMDSYLVDKQSVGKISLTRTTQQADRYFTVIHPTKVNKYSSRESLHPNRVD